MNESYFDLHVSFSNDEADILREILPAILTEMGFEGFLDDDNSFHCYIKKNNWHETLESDLRSITEQYLLPPFEILSITEIPYKNWNEDWEQSIQPIQVSENIIITPSWHPILTKDKLVLTIDPKMTFGTGYHESTRLMLRLIAKYVSPNCLVLDVGTGTGILAIASIKFGASSAIGIDIDEWTLDNGMENANQNNVEKYVQFRIGSLEVVPEYHFDIILANIIKNTIIELLDEIILKISSAGTILLSGLLTDDQDSISMEVSKRGYAIVEVLRENDWIALAVQKK